MCWLSDERAPRPRAVVGAAASTQNCCIAMNVKEPVMVSSAAGSSTLAAAANGPDLVIAAVGDSTLRDIWLRLVTRMNQKTRSNATKVRGQAHNMMTADIHLPNRRRVSFVFQYIPGVQSDTKELPPPRCRSRWWKSSSWSRAKQAQSAIEWVLPLGAARPKSLLLYGGIQQSLPSGRAVRELALGVSSCLPEVQLVVKSVHPALVVMDPASGKSSSFATRTAALHEAEILDAKVASALKGSRAIWWNISSVLQHVGARDIVGSPICGCHYNDKINERLAQLALGKSWWPPVYRI